MELEQQVASHYGRGELVGKFDSALRQAGKDPERLTTDDLGPFEDFHIGGRQATADLAMQLELRPGMRLLDIGCGIGGPARFFAERYGCEVTGIDLTEDFVLLADVLTRRLGLDGLVSFRQGSALDLLFEAESFDRVCLLHVGMNIADKQKLFTKAHRVLKAGGMFAIYDVMRMTGGGLQFPLPWAAAPETSFVETADAYRDLLRKAGFVIAAERNRLELATAFFREMMERSRGGSRPLLGPQLIMGENAGPMFLNAISATEQGIIAPVEIIARKS